MADPWDGDATRYRMLEPVRQYAREKLLASGEWEDVRDRHAAWFLPIAERTYREMDGPRHGAWLQMLEAEHDNLRAALEWYWTDGCDPEAGMLLAAGLFPFSVVHGHGTEGRVWLRRFLSSAEGREVSESARAKALTAAGILANYQSDHLEAVALSEESLKLWRRLDDQEGIAICLNGLCAARALSFDFEQGDPVCWESLALSRRVHNRAGIVSSLMFLGVAAQGRGDHGRARTFFHDCERTCRELEMGRSAFAGWLMSHWSRSEVEEGDYASAHKLATEVERIAQDLVNEHYGHLLGVRITCCFMNKTPTSKGRAVWGRAKKISGLPAFLADENGMPEDYEDQPPDFFVIEISEEEWSLLSEKGKRALVDEQLVKLDIVEDDEGRVTLAVRDRGIVLIPELIQRHGLYNDSLKGAAAIGAEQLELLPEEERDQVRAGQIAQELHDEMQQRGIEVTMLAGKPEEVDRETDEVLEGSRA